MVVRLGHHTPTFFTQPFVHSVEAVNVLRTIQVIIHPSIRLGMLSAAIERTHQHSKVIQQGLRHCRIPVAFYSSLHMARMNQYRLNYYLAFSSDSRLHSLHTSEAVYMRSKYGLSSSLVWYLVAPHCTDISLPFLYILLYPILLSSQQTSLSVLWKSLFCQRAFTRQSEVWIPNRTSTSLYIPFIPIGLLHQVLSNIRPIVEPLLLIDINRSRSVTIEHIGSGILPSSVFS